MTISEDCYLRPVVAHGRNCVYSNKSPFMSVEFHGDNKVVKKLR